MIIFWLAQLVAKIRMLDYLGVKIVPEFEEKLLCGLNGRIAHDSNSALPPRAGPCTVRRLQFVALLRVPLS